MRADGLRRKQAAYPIEDVACYEHFYWKFYSNVADLGCRDCRWILA